MSLTRDQILKADDLKKEQVDVSKWWGGSVYVSEMSGDARDEFEQYMAEQYKANKEKKAQYAHIRAFLAAWTVVDENGTRLFSFDDALALGRKNAKPLDKIFEASNRLNKVFGAERDDVEKNSETTLGDNSGGE